MAFKMHGMTFHDQTRNETLGGVSHLKQTETKLSPTIAGQHLTKVKDGYKVSGGYARDGQVLKDPSGFVESADYGVVDLDYKVNDKGVIIGVKDSKGE